MRALLLATLLFQSILSLGQNSTELKQLKERLSNEKLKLNQSLQSIDEEIDSLEQVITLTEAKENGIKSSLKRNSKLRLLPKYNSQIIESIEKKEQVIIINKYKYGTYYYAIYKNQYGYIEQKDVKQKKEFQHLTSVESTKSNANQIKNYSPTYSRRKVSKTSRKYSRRYYRGPRGGCYYINSNGNKTYVARSLCN